MLIKDICKENLICANASDDLMSVSKLMLVHDVGFLPIKDNDIVIGVLTDRDIVIRGISSNKYNVKEIISTNIISIDMNADVEAALNCFRQYKIKRLLVKNNNEYIGVISLSDILKSNKDKLILDTIKSIFEEEPHNENVEIDTFEL